MKELIKLLDPALKYVSHERVGGTLVFHVEAESQEAICPYCGTVSTREHSHGERRFSDLPVGGEKVSVVVRRRKMFCDNPDCGRTTFAERFDCLAPYARRSKRLERQVVAASLSMSSEEAAGNLRDGVVDISGSTVLRALKRIKGVEVIPKENVRGLHVDDWATKKRHVYATCFVDLDTGCLVDVVPSREKEDITEKLKEYPNLEFVVRDGSLTYRSAAAEAGIGMQISDRFHLEAGLGEAATRHIQGRLPRVVPLAGLVDGAAAQDAPTSAQEKRMERIRRAHELKDRGMTQVDIAKELGVTRVTVAADLKLRPEDVAGNPTSGPAPFAKVLPYAKQIASLMAAGATQKAIFDAIREKGYKGGHQVLGRYVRATRDHGLRPANGESIARSLLVKRVYFDVDEIKGLDQEQLEKAVALYPSLGEVYKLVADFKALFENHDALGLHDWLDAAEACESSSIQQFARAVRRDLGAVLGAIITGVANGVAEGTVNKIKVVKRVMYGRCSFETLRTKLLLRERRALDREHGMTGTIGA